MMSETKEEYVEKEVGIVVTKMESEVEDEFSDVPDSSGAAVKIEEIHTSAVEETKVALAPVVEEVVAAVVEVEAPVVEEVVTPVEVKEEISEKIASYNEDAIASAKSKEDSDGSEENKNCFPSFFIDEDETQDVEVDILSNKENGKILSVSRTGLVDMEEFDFLRSTSVKFTFTVPTYDDIIRYRQQSRSFSREANKEIIDNVQMRNFYLIWHLSDWTLTDSKGKKVELVHSEEGALDDKSIKCVYKMPASLLDVVLTLFEKDVLVS